MRDNSSLAEAAVLQLDGALHTEERKGDGTAVTGAVA